MRRPQRPACSRSPACAATPRGPTAGPTCSARRAPLTLKREPAAYGVPQHAALPLAAGEVVITFDDGPSPESTPRVLAALRAQCARATFFMVRRSAVTRPGARAAGVRAEGHSTGLHGFTHAHAGAQSASEQLAELRDVQEAYRRAFDVAAPAWRFPFLEETPTLTQALKAQAITIMSVWTWPSTTGCSDQGPRVLGRPARSSGCRTAAGGIILMHDAQDQTAAALPLLLATLKAHGYRVVHLEWEPDLATVTPNK